MSRRRGGPRRAPRKTPEELVLETLDSDASADTAATVRLSKSYDEVGLVLLFGWYDFALALARRPLRRVRWWADVPLEVVTPKKAQVAEFGRPGFALETLEERGIKVVEMEDEQLSEVLERAGVGGWIVLSKIASSARRDRDGGAVPVSRSWVVGVYGEEPGDLDWITPDR